MMKNNIFKKIALAILFVFAVIFAGGIDAEAARLKVEKDPKAHTAVIVVEDFTNKKQVHVDDVSSIGKLSQAIRWYEDNAIERNKRYVSTDPELLEYWKKAVIEAGGEVKNEEEDYHKISAKAKKMLKKGKTLYSFETKFIVPDKGKQFQQAASAVLGIAALVRIL